MSLKSITKLFETSLIHIRKSQRKTLSVVVYGILRGAKLGVAAMGRNMAGSALIKHKIKKMDRFLGNERISIAKGVAALIQWIVRGKSRIYVAVDWTPINEDYQTLKAGVVTNSRALPIFWKTVKISEIFPSQNVIEEDFFKALKRILPPNVEVVLLMDRGFDRVELLKFLEDLGFLYVIRVSTDIWIESKQFTGNLSDYRIWRGVLKDFGRIRYQKRERFPVRMVATFQMGQEEPWFLVSNIWDVPGRFIVSYYARRMEVEEFFKDMKNVRSGLQAKGLKLSAAERYDRLFLALAYAYFLLVLAGVYAEKKNIHG